MYLKYKITKFNKLNMQDNINNLVKESESHTRFVIMYLSVVLILLSIRIENKQILL